jgi:hypothetical protein
VISFDLPFHTIYPGGSAVIAARHSYDLTSRIQFRSAGSDVVNGSDAKPLILRMMYNFMPEDLGATAINYTELVLDNGDGVRAPTDYVWRSCAGGVGPYPVICQQNRTFEPGVNAFCPSLAAGPLPEGGWPSLAVGPNALLDADPCDAADGQRPSVAHCAVFDGKTWVKLVAGRFPGNGGDFHLDWQANTFQLTIRTSGFDVEHWGNDRETGEAHYSKATIPRRYLGPFNRISHGMGAGCELNFGTGTCIDGRTCFNYNQTAQETWPSIGFDSPVLLDGLFAAQLGACCVNNGTCSVNTRVVCEAAGGRFHGGSRCEETVCCPLPFADADHDKDVDQEDVASFQQCFSGPNGTMIPGCECFDRDDDRDVDEGDATAFGACATGSHVLWEPELTPLCRP